MHGRVSSERLQRVEPHARPPSVLGRRSRLQQNSLTPPRVVHLARNAAAAAAAASVAEPVAPPDPAPDHAQHGPGSFRWTSNWYPVATLNSLDPSVPNSVMLLGIKLALWRDGSGRWSALEDRCPHRASPLSQGRIEASTGHLHCSYHGWSFDATGQCQGVPQSQDPDSVCRLKAACARSFLVRECQGLLWVWPEAGEGASARAAAVHPSPHPEIEGDRWTFLMPFLQRDVQVSYEVLIENGHDMAHQPFVHHGLNGLRSDAVPGFDIRVTEDSPRGVVCATDSPIRTASTRMTVNFLAPSTYSQHSVLPPSPKGGFGGGLGSEMLLLIYRTPVSPGVTRSFGTFVVKDMAPAVARGATRTPVFMRHLNALRFQDGDYVLMHEQERTIEAQGGWRRAFFLPDPTDSAALALRVWLDKAGPLPWPAHSSRLPPALPREQVLDHFHQHVVHCPDCQRGLRLVRALQVAAAAGAVVLGSCAIVGLAVLAQGGAVLLLPKAALLAVCAAVAGVVAWAGLKAKAYEHNFFYRDYVHSRL